MTVHEQLKMLRNLLEDEEFKRRQRLRSDQESRDQVSSKPVTVDNNNIKKREKKDEKKGDLKEEPKWSKAMREVRVKRKHDDGCTCTSTPPLVKPFEERTYEELANLKPGEDEGVGPLPLTEENLSVIRNNSKAHWNVVSASQKGAK